MTKPDPIAILDDPDGLPVIEDMMRTWEAELGDLPGKVSAAHIYWLQRIKATDPERGRTLYVADAHTTMESYPSEPVIPPGVEEWKAKSILRDDKRNGTWPTWFAILRQELGAHPKAIRFRVVKPWGHYIPALGEVVLVRRKKRNKFFVDVKCNVPECTHAYPLLRLTLSGGR